MAGIDSNDAEKSNKNRFRGDKIRHDRRPERVGVQLPKVRAAIKNIIDPNHILYIAVHREDRNCGADGQGQLDGGS